VLSEEPVNCTIVEAARATSAAPTFFDPVRINNGATLRDGGMLNNNPIEELVNEVTTQREFQDKEISCIVSIGTGMLKQNILGDSLATVAKNCANIATETEGTHRAFEDRECGDNGRFRGKYFRFNVAHGVEDVSLEEWKAMAAMYDFTYSYLKESEIRDKVIRCSDKLRASFSERCVLSKLPPFAR